MLVNQWKKNGLIVGKKKGFKNKKNPDLWMRFLKIFRKHSVRFFWIKGHNNNPRNERCDFLAVKAAESRQLETDSWYEKNSSNPQGKLF